MGATDPIVLTLPNGMFTFTSSYDNNKWKWLNDNYVDLYLKDY